MRQANRHTKTRILGGVLSFARTHGTAAFFLAGSGIDGCFPNMTFVASPPYSLMAPRCYHFRCQTDIQRIVPLSSDSWIKRCKIVEASQNAPSRAVWAARVLYNSCSNDGLPFVPKCASPPNPPVAEGSNLVWSQTSVALCVPLCGDVWKGRRQIILAGHHGLPSANRASRTSASAEYASSP